MSYGGWVSAAAVFVVAAAFSFDDAARPAGAPAASPQDAPKKGPQEPAKGNPHEVKSPEPAPIPVYDGPLIALTGNERGFIRPCGCSKPKLGGIDKRAFALTKLREKNPQLVAVATGGLLAEGGRQQELKLEAFLFAMSAMNYAAFVPGADDFRVGARALLERKDMASFPFVLANAKIGDAAFAPQVPLGASGGVLIGLVAPMAPETGVTTTPAAEALAREIASCADAAFVLVVFNGPEEGLDALGAVVPEALRAKTLFAIPGHADSPIEWPKPTHGMPVVLPGGKGRAIGLVRPGKKPLLDSYVLVEKQAADAAVGEILSGYKNLVREENLVTALNRTAPAAKYVGDVKCAECHAQAVEDLVDSKHQKAFETLVKSGDERDPECVKCHVTGWALEGGYVDVDATPERRDVDCEQCHGPGSEHSTPKLTKTPGGKVDAATCVKCHDPDNSPQFNFETYWPKIVHR